MTNSNCLENIKCPACGNEDRFRIAGTTIFTITDDGTEDHGDVEWNDGSYAECAECHRHGTLKDFEVRSGLEPEETEDEKLTTPRHTPGPWQQDWQFIVAPDPDGVHADIYIAEDDSDGRVASPEQHDANGRLIAAAPAMLEALRLAQRALNTAPRFRVGDTDSYKIAAQVDEAIAQADARRREPL